MFVVAVFTFGFIYGIDYLVNTVVDVPQEFQEAYQEAALSSQQVISLTRSINQKIEEIDNSDFQGDYQNSLELISEALSEAETVKEEAKNLKTSLNKIDTMFETIEESPQLDTVSEAIVIELKFVDELIIYAEELDTFLQSLQQAIKTDNRENIAQKLESVNQQKQVVNNLNEQFISKLEELNN